MFTARRRSRFVFGLASGTLPLLLALSLHGQPPPTVSLVPGSGSPKQVADDLDSIVQPRFQVLTTEKFGTSRVTEGVQGHLSVGYFGSLRANTVAEAALLTRADAAHRPYVIAFLHCAPVPKSLHQTSLPNSITGLPTFTLLPSDVLPPPSLPRFHTIVIKPTSEGYPSNYSEKTEPLLQVAALKVLPPAKKGQAVQTETADWTLFLRPVTASKEACLGCHATAKRGDTLGVMVYAVGKTPAVN